VHLVPRFSYMREQELEKRRVVATAMLFGVH
jgi:hypothetical protein